MIYADHLSRSLAYYAAKYKSGTKILPIQCTSFTAQLSSLALYMEKCDTYGINLDSILFFNCNL